MLSICMVVTWCVACGVASDWIIFCYVYLLFFLLPCNITILLCFELYKKP
jgi:hypothetical protein